MSILGDVATNTEHLLADQFEEAGFKSEWAPIYAQMLVGAVSQIGQWWMEVREPPKQVVAVHVVNLTWNGLRNLRPQPTLRVDKFAEPNGGSEGIS